MLQVHQISTRKGIVSQAESGGGMLFNYHWEMEPYKEEEDTRQSRLFSIKSRPYQMPRQAEVVQIYAELVAAGRELTDEVFAAMTQFRHGKVRFGKQLIPVDRSAFPILMIEPITFSAAGT
jgi:hypothetical protein